MNETTLYKLERERKDKILNLKPDEVERYINSLNKRMAAAYGNVWNNFTPDVEASMKAADLCDEVVELLKNTYPNVATYVAWSRVDTLVDKLRETTDDVHDLRLKRSRHDLIMAYSIMGIYMVTLSHIMDLYYDFYTCRGRYDNVFHLISKTALDEDDKCKVVNALDDLPIYDFYNSYYMKSMDMLLNILIRSIDKHYGLLKDLSNFTIDDETTDDDFFNKFRNDMLEYQQLSKDLLKYYEAYMEDGFQVAKERERQILCEMWHENILYKDGTLPDKDYVEYIEYNRPSYDLKSMTFIPSQYELDRMAAYEEGHKE